MPSPRNRPTAPSYTNNAIILRQRHAITEEGVLENRQDKGNEAYIPRHGESGHCRDFFNTLFMISLYEPNTCPGDRQAEV
jgi:hypothetical protein